MGFISKYRKLILFSIPVISLLLHLHVFNMDLVGIHVWRQTETQTTINNFYTEDFNILHPRYNQHADTNRLHRMEFPIMQWIFSLFYKLFGPHIIISRILSFIIGLFSVYGMYYLSGNVFKNKSIATLCAWCFNWSPVFYYYTVNPMPDNLALCCAIWSLGFFYRYVNTANNKSLVLSSVFLCLSALAKLPFIIYGSFIGLFLVLLLKQRKITWQQLIRICGLYAIMIIPTAVWYISVVPDWQNGTIRGIFEQGSEHSNLFAIFVGTIVSVIPELLINYASILFFIAGVYLFFKNDLYRNRYFFPFLLLGIFVSLYFMYEMNMIALVHDYYMFPFLPPIFLIVAYGAYQLLSHYKRLRLLAIACLAVLPLTAFLRADSRWDLKDPGFNPTYYTYKNELRSLAPPNVYCIAGNDVSGYILLYYINHKGWTFYNDNLDEPTLLRYINDGAQYLYTDSYIDTIPNIKNHLAEKVFDKGTLRVYKLK